MSYITTRTFIPEGLADVFTFKTKRHAEEWIARTIKFWAKAIKRKQVHVEYVGKSGLHVGVYMGHEPEITWKCKGEENADTEGRRITQGRAVSRPGREAQAPQTTSQESRSVDRRKERVAP